MTEGKRKLLTFPENFSHDNFRWLYKRRGKIKHKYLDCVACFDTETSHLADECGWIYQWSILVGAEIVVGRKPSEFIETLKHLEELYNLDENTHMILYVHNLSYDITYLLPWIIEEWGEPEILAVDTHKVLQLSFGGFILKCSYILSNMSLNLWCEKLHTTIRKKVGTVDYDAIHYQDSALTEKDDIYMIGDVECLAECISKTLDNDGDTLLTIPLTSTGYVRRDCRKACRNEKYRHFFIKTQLNVKTYKMCKNAFAGGYTHANRFYVNKTLKGRIKHFDKKSFYPSVQMLNYFPVTKFELLYKYGKDTFRPIEFFKHYLKNQCCLFSVYIKNCKLKSGITAPYMQFSKLIGGKKVKCDNGRVLGFQDWGEYTLTELDFEILCKQYEFSEIIMNEIYIAERGDMPEEIKRVVMEYFVNKETLEKDCELYMKSKNKLNSVYGMTATDIVRAIFELDNNRDITKKLKLSDEEIAESLEKYYKSRNSFMPYQFGVWTTAHCRHQLLLLIEKIGYENFIYSDTDSIFFFETEENKKFIEEHNNLMIRKNNEKGYHGVKNRDNELSFFCTFEDEEDDITAFKTCHAKCYAMISKGKLNVTIAGVTKDNKKLGKDRVTIDEELGCIDNLKGEFTFTECGGTRSKYVHNEPCKVNIDGHLTEISDACIILRIDKKISELSDIITEYEEV